MPRRVVLVVPKLPLVGASLLLAMVQLPLAAAQTTPEVRFTLASSMTEMVLPENGKHGHEIDVRAVAKDFTCLQDARVSIETALEPHEKWAGASLNPRNASFLIRQGSPGTSPVTLDGQRIRLEVEWDVENRPKTDARWEYKIAFVPGQYHFQGGPCVPLQANPAFGDALTLVVTMADVVENEPSPDCEMAPELPECDLDAADEKEVTRTPGFEWVLVGAAVMGTLWLRRRGR